MTHIYIHASAENVTVPPLDEVFGRCVCGRTCRRKAFFRKRNDSRTRLVQSAGRAGTNLGRGGLR